LVFPAVHLQPDRACELVVDPNAAPLLAARRWPLIVASVPLRSGSIRGSNLLAQALAEELNGLAKIIRLFESPLIGDGTDRSGGRSGRSLPYPT
jgi:hypothetical protein